MEKSGLLEQARKVCLQYKTFIETLGSDPIAAQSMIVEFTKSINALGEEINKADQIVELFKHFGENDSKDQPAENKLRSVADMIEKLSDPNKMIETLNQLQPSVNQKPEQ